MNEQIWIIETESKVCVCLNICEYVHMCVNMHFKVF